MPSVFAMFPGQGSQYVGMGKALLENFSDAKTVFEEAEDATGFSIRKVCIDGPDRELTLTANTQPCILAVSLATWRILQQETGLAPTVFAGHSLGEYSAVVAAGILDLSRAATLVRKRGQAMQEATPPGVGAMAAVVNCPVEDLQKRCSAVSTASAIVEIANFNSPQQLVVAGHKSAVDTLCRGLEEDGVRVVSLPVSAPFHSRLMTKAKSEMAPLLNKSEFHDSDKNVIPNLTGEVTRSYSAKFLVEQIDSPVLWTQTLKSAHAMDCDTYVEVGPGRVLFGLARKTLPRGQKIVQTDDLVKGYRRPQSVATSIGS